MDKYLLTSITVSVAMAAPTTGVGQTVNQSVNSTISTHSSSTTSSTTSSTSSTVSSSNTNAGSESEYLSRVGARFDRFTGSRANTQALVQGLHTGSRIRLAGRTRGETEAFIPATRPMSYDNVTRAIDLAQRQLAAAGIRNPTPGEIKAALNGGTIATPNGEVALAGVLRLRNQGLAWGGIEQAIGLQPHAGKNRATASSSVTTPGVTTSAGGPQGATAGGANVTFGEGGMRVQAGDANVTTGR